jgi:hypothetical protein
MFTAFAKFLEVAPKEIAKKTYLYVHTAWPDAGWDIPDLIKEIGISHRTYFTYICEKCGEVYPSFFQDTRSVCKFCGNNSLYTPTISHGVSAETMGEIYSLFDTFVSYATAGGFEIPIAEAAACGVPVFAVDYSAMSDVVRKVNGFPIKVERFFRDYGTNADRAYPLNDDLIQKTIDFLSMPNPVRFKYGQLAREGVDKYYTWERTAKIWEDYFDSVDISKNVPWDAPQIIHEPELNIPENLSDYEFVHWAFENIAGRPDLKNSYLANRIARDLACGVSLEGLPNALCTTEHTNESYARFGSFTRERVAGHLLHLSEGLQEFERRRVKK